jgi:formamidopyrimidine-DNA glycosylase
LRKVTTKYGKKEEVITSIELPEAHILAEQMDRELRWKQITSYSLFEYQKMQRIGFINKNLHDFDLLLNRRIECVVSRGNVIRIQISEEMNLLLAPEYGGRIHYHVNQKLVPEKVHLRVDFADNTALTVRLTGMGFIYAANDHELEQVYVYRRDFSETPSPLDRKEFTFEYFSRLLQDKRTTLKAALVGREAVVVGLGNSAFQDVAYRARLHPKRTTTELSLEEKLNLYEAIQLLVQERIRFGGKDQFFDLHGEQGHYAPTMGPNMKDKTCPACGNLVDKLSAGGGFVYYCPKCQK